jgi:hypothetical protein
MDEQTREKVRKQPAWVQNLIQQLEGNIVSLTRENKFLFDENCRLRELLDDKLAAAGKDSTTFLETDTDNRIPLGHEVTITFGENFEATLSGTGDLHITCYRPVAVIPTREGELIIQPHQAE